ncbi:VOC family protein [Deinococcus arenicola]|uniref:VOC family protein n=1 Tax=Deinococcus arenicola TaxID=2994950 RepID=A0ABU4DN28_9DEIO|nr:VOC family protein [Deinococcus sp. ZS9-10]MDV6373842.1 VOC family protein [Deinococcus sp. ZS9-10]
MMTTFPVLPTTASVGTVTLLTADLPRLRSFYTNLLGLRALSESFGEVTLEAQGTPLLRLKATDLTPPAVSRPGLYHTAFLLPTRADLGRWLAHAAQSGLRIGSGDHLVSEAFYFSDPDGNGIEIYADRPRNTWTYDGDQVRMDTLAVDSGAVLQSAGLDPQDLQNAPAYTRAPAGTVLGHVHLKVGDAQEAARFYRDTLGLTVMADMGSATFLSWGGYHHHVGLNEWHTRGQTAPQAPTLGLAEVTFLTPDLAGLRAHLAGRTDVQDDGDTLSLRDPWGNALRVQKTV